MQLNIKTAEVLNNLVRLNANRIQGYHKVARNINSVDENLKDIFTKLAGDSAYCISQLFPYIIQSGIQPAVEGVNTDVFQTLKNNLLYNSSNKTIGNMLNPDDFDQDNILDAYYQALNEIQFPTEVYNIINEQTTTLRKTHSAIINYCAS